MDPLQVGRYTRQAMEFWWVQVVLLMDQLGDRSTDPTTGPTIGLTIGLSEDQKADLLMDDQVTTDLVGVCTQSLWADTVVCVF